MVDEVSRSENHVYAFLALSQIEGESAARRAEGLFRQIRRVGNPPSHSLNPKAFLHLTKAVR